MSRVNVRKHRCSIDPRDTRPFLIKALKTFARREEGRPQRKHENMRL